ncbi:TldD/PmbA family protein [Desulfitobacterium sp.]|uniref:TldD/PmbA family protein n=1 Tax=Desulfitobacterium sp. TaxID=49981 RepID=UPI002C83A84C|nr:TldD/PmbA family protein [Desulfitobacterium sp.]HVJ48167.1 TldD/PmbA family protein [Desulfitobacterium sp.]
MNQNELRELVDQLFKESQNEYCIVRLESRREWGMRLSNGRFERVSSGWDSGIGVQAFTQEGASGFASADVLSLEVGRQVMQRATSLAERNAQIGAECNREILKAPRIEEDAEDPRVFPFEHFSLAELQTKVLGLHQRLLERNPKISWQTSYRQVEDLWCIGRSDGTRVSFVIPRALLMHQGTVRENERAQSTLVQRSGVDVGILQLEQEDAFLETKALERAEFAKAVCRAPQLPSGHYPLVIDYGLAKGLAHEAFGHAVESDHMKESVLGEKGKLKKGLKVARSGVQIIDGPLVGDWAYQPYSANGLKRETVQIVKDGVLLAGLGDIFSAEEAGMEVTGAGRAESYGYIPLPRMTNIRLIVDQAIPIPQAPSLREEIRQVREVLKEKGELREEGKHLLLLGYRGGQVNPKTGDFVFQCDGMIDLADPNLPVYQPSIFSGKILSALQAIRAGLGQGCYDAIGTCGKSGQAVPSSGGSHRYLLLEQDEQVSLGGEQG